MKGREKEEGREKEGIKRRGNERRNNMGMQTGE